MAFVGVSSHIYNPGSVCLVTCSLHALSAYIQGVPKSVPMFERLGYPIFSAPMNNFHGQHEENFLMIWKITLLLFPMIFLGELWPVKHGNIFFGTPCMNLRSSSQHDDAQRDVTCHRLSASCDQQICHTDIIFWASPYHLIISSLASHQPPLCEECELERDARQDLMMAIANNLVHRLGWWCLILFTERDQAQECNEGSEWRKLGAADSLSGIVPSYQI